MESLLTLTIGEYRAVELALKLVVALIGMTAVLLALSAVSVTQRYKLSLIIAAVALGGAAWFQYGVWEAWKEAFELAGTSYCVTGHLLDGEDRIIAWSLGVPAILFSFGLAHRTSGTQEWMVTGQGIFFLLVGLVALFSTSGAFVLLVVPMILLNKSISFGLESKLALAAVFFGLILSDVLAWHPLPLGGGASGELERGELLRSVLDIFSLVIPGVLLLIGVLRLSNQEVLLSSSLPASAPPHEII